MLSGDSQSAIGLWDLESGVAGSMLKLPTSQMDDIAMGVAFQTTSIFCALQRSGHLSLGDVRQKQWIQWRFQAHLLKGTCFRYRGNGWQVLTSARGSEIKLWDLRKPPTSPSDYLHLYNSHKSQTLPVAFDFLRYETYLATGSDDNRVCIYDLNTGEVVCNLRLGIGLVQTVCPVDADSLSFFVSYMNAQYLGYVDCVGEDATCSFNSAADIKQRFQQEAWATAVSRLTDRIMAAVRTVAGETLFGYDNWQTLIEQAETEECREIRKDLQAEYTAVLNGSMSQFVHKLQNFYRPRELERTAINIRRKSEFAPKVRSEKSYSSKVNHGYQWPQLENSSQSRH